MLILSQSYQSCMQEGCSPNPSWAKTHCVKEHYVLCLIRVGHAHGLMRKVNHLCALDPVDQMAAQLSNTAARQAETDKQVVATETIYFSTIIAVSLQSLKCMCTAKLKNLHIQNTLPEINVMLCMVKMLAQKSDKFSTNFGSNT